MAATVAPSERKSLVVASPIPEAAPLIRQTRPRSAKASSTVALTRSYPELMMAEHSTRPFATRQELNALWLDLFGRPNPEKIICVGLNYRSHSAEQNVEPPTHPLLFAKWPNALIGSAEPIRLPRISSQVDFEAELGVVVGERGERVGIHMPQRRLCP